MSINFKMKNSIFQEICLIAKLFINQTTTQYYYIITIYL